MPETADSSAPAQWVHVSADRSASWHDHRVHWMGNTDPAAVQTSPHEHHTIIDGWELGLHVDGRQRTVTGQTRWVPPPPVAPWLVVAVVAAGISFLSSFGVRLFPAVAIGVCLLGATTVVGVALTMSDPPGGAAIALMLPVCLTLFGLVRAHFGDHDWAVSSWGLAGIVAVVSIAYGSFFTHSQLPTALAAPVARLVLSLTVGAGIGAAAGIWATAITARRGAGTTA